MTKYSMSQVENFTGIKAHTLRIWEKRYDILKPNRTDTNIRYYSDLQLKQLLNIGILQNNGFRISTISKMTADEIFESVSNIIGSHDSEFDDQISGLVLSMIEMDEDAFSKIFENQVFRTGLLSTVVNLIYPFLSLVGGLWTNNKSIPAQEHFISNLIRQKIISAIDAIPSPTSEAKRILLFLPEGEDHEVGLLLSYYIAKDLGYKVYYLGQNVPLSDLPETVKLVKPDLLFTIFQITKHDKIEEFLEAILNVIEVPLLLSASKRLIEAISPRDGLKLMLKPDDYVNYLKLVNIKSEVLK